MKRSFFLASVVVLVVVSCSPNPKSNDLNKEIIGEWRNIYLKISMNEGVKDSVRVTECDSTNWEKMLGIKPIHTFFNEDGTYRSDYYTLKDSLFRTSSGSWTIVGDTITMNELKPSVAIYKMKTSIDSGVATFEGMLDFDQDGKKDDHYLGRQRKQ